MTRGIEIQSGASSPAERGQGSFPARTSEQQPRGAEVVSFPPKSGTNTAAQEVVSFRNVGHEKNVTPDARVGGVDPRRQLHCLVEVDPNEVVRDGLWEWLHDYTPITYGQLDELKKQGLSRPRKGQ